MDEDATWYGVEIGAGHIVLDGFPALRERGTAPPPLLGPCLWPRLPISATAELLFRKPITVTVFIDAVQTMMIGNTVYIDDNDEDDNDVDILSNDIIFIVLQHPMLHRRDSIQNTRNMYAVTQQLSQYMLPG